MIISADTPEELCPAGHQLRKFTTASDGYRCDGCGNQFPTGTVLRGCRQCDYDVCSDCVGKGTVIKVRDAPAIRAPGTRVRLKGVTGAPEFNGKLGETAAYDPERGRQHVVLDDDGGTIWVRLECMEDADLATDGLAGAELADEPTASPGLADKPTASLGSTASAPRISKGLSSGGLSPGTTPAELGRVLLGAAFLPDAPSIGSKVEVNCPGLAAFTGTIRGITDEKVDIMENVEGGRIFRMPVEILSQPDVCRVVKDTDLGPSGPLTNGGSLTNGSGPRNSISPEYALLMELFGEELQKLTMKSLFDFIDDDKNGKLSIDELEGRMPLINELMRRRDGATSDLTLDTLAIDEDGNGVISFHEFAEWAGPRLGLSLGMKLDFSACGILGCPCHEYRPCQKPRLKRGRTGLGRLIESVRKEFAGADKFPRCRCGHKISAHNIRNRTVGEIPFPDNWIHRCGDFTELVPAQNGPFMFGVDKFQAVVDYTYRNTWTRDRKKHNPSSPNVPRGFRVTGVRRCENSRNWTEYIFKKSQILEDRAANPEDWLEVLDVKSNIAVAHHMYNGRPFPLNSACNEWYLFHGTSPTAAVAICESDFKISFAGGNTGTLYGKGIYLAESITKADEYAKINGFGDYTVLLCRVLGARVRYTDELEPDPEELVTSCIEGPYGCVLGDREKSRGTYREFVVFDTEDVYPEYIINYQRIM